MAFFDKEKLSGALNKAKDSLINAKDSVVKAAQDAAGSMKDVKAEMDADNAAMVGSIAKYEVIYIGGLPQYQGRKSGDSIGFNIMEDRFYFKKGYVSKKWFEDFEIPYSSVKKLEIVERVVTNAEMLLSSSSSDMKTMEQKNNVEITFDTVDGLELVLRVEMLTGTTIYGQTAKCREMMDVLRQHGILKKFKGEGAPAAAAAPQGEDVLGQIEKLAKLKDAGILSEDEFAQKKAELLAKL